MRHESDALRYGMRSPFEAEIPNGCDMAAQPEWAVYVGGPRCGEALQIPRGTRRCRSGKTGDKRVHLYLRSDRTANVGGRACVVFTHSEVWS